MKVLVKLESLFWQGAGLVFSRRTLAMMKFDLKRFRARLKRLRARNVVPPYPLLHMGCGPVRVSGWLNVDVTHSDYDVDLASVPLPWESRVFEAVVGEHFIEHLDLRSEVLPLFREILRILIPGGELWLSTPDIEKICKAYLQDRMQAMINDRKLRWPRYSLGEFPSTQMINDLFHQGGAHKNLFDFALLHWALQAAGFIQVERRDEASLLNRFPGFPPRRDEMQTLYVRAMSPN